jgi:gluconate 2-dehydrogenase gamma chain
LTGALAGLHAAPVTSAFRSSRRRFLEGLAGVLLLPRPSSAEPGEAPQPACAAHPAFFSAAQRANLAALADHVLPGAARLGAVEYIEQLLSAFDFDPPRIHAGGPFSGRRPFAEHGRASDSFPPADFEHWLPLDRVAERAWRLRLYGSSEGDPLGPVTGLRPLLQQGADLRWSAQSDEFRTRFTELVIEACYADPVYGGNRGEAGWRALGFEGDSLPLGFMPWDESSGSYRERPDAPYSRVGGDPDPAPLGWRTRVQLWFLAFLSRRMDLS